MKKILLPLLSILCSFVSSVLGQSAPPNIVVILADDLGYGEVSINGCPDYQTPNIDSIANNGVLCTNGYVTHPFCSPSRAALLTGRYNQRFGYQNNLDNDPANIRLGLPMSETLLPQLLKPAGYACGAIGKWHLGQSNNFHPLNRGFDEFFGFLDVSSNYYNAHLLRGFNHVTETAYLTEAFTREAVSFIDRHATEPFFLYVAYNAPHTPYDTPPATYMNRVANITDPKRQKYAAMIVALDDGVGQVVQALQANNLLDKTLIFFLSDNGTNEASFTRNAPLRGYKQDVLEGGIRVPFAVQWTGHFSPTLYDELVSSLDILSTAAAAAGVSLPTDRTYDGLNILPYLAGQQIAPQRNLFWEWFGLGQNGPPGSVDTIWAVRSGPLKLVTERAAVGQPPALYNLPNDIDETQDLAAAQPADVNALTALYNQWTTKLISPLWQFNTNFPKSLVMAGDWNGFNKNDSSFPWELTWTSAPSVNGTPDGFDWFTNTIHVAASGGDTTPGPHSFALVGNGDYAKQWGGAAINIDAVTSVPFFSGAALAPPNTISLQAGFYYSFRIVDPVMDNLNNRQIDQPLTIAVMQTFAPPISVTVTGRTPTAPSAGDPVVVNIATSQAKSSQERIYLRWSKDFFVTSKMVAAAGSGLNYSATIPGQPNNTGIQYCAVTSTADLSSFDKSGAIDALILATTGVSKYVTSGGSPTPTPTPTPTPNPTSVDLKVTVNDGNTSIAAGQKDTYTIKVTNVGPAAISGATVSDSFPAALTGVTFTATQSGGVVGFTASGSGNINDNLIMPVGSSVTYKASGKVSATATGTISDTASVAPPLGVSDSKPANNSATDSDTIAVNADLKITVTDGKSTVTAGQKNTYTIVVTNTGPSNVTAAAVSDSFPAAFTGVTFTATQSGGASGFTATGSGNINNTVALPAGSHITYKAKGTISSSATGTISDTATVTAPIGVTDPNLANNSATDTDTL